MRVLVASDFTVYKAVGKYYAKSQHSTIIKRYARAFGALTVCCRVAQGEEITSSHEDVTADLAEVISVRGLADTLTGRCRQRIEPAVKQSDLVIGRLHSMIACVAADCAKRCGKPFFAELMGDAWDAYWNHSLVGKVIAPYMFLKTRQVVKNADYALYVTNKFLQERYPCKNESVAASNVLIDRVDPAVLDKRLGRITARDPKQITLMTTAAVDVRYKGQEYVIRAIPLLNKAGIRVKYVMIGGGSQDFLRRVAAECGVEDQVEFTGRMPLDEVFLCLDEVDIYLQPSLQEGLPRSVIEAMSRGCPVIGARTAGIPELIAPECVVRRKSAKDVADKVLAINSKEKLAQLAKQNFAEAGGYQDEILCARRNAYFDKIKRDIESGLK